jgi:uncharacterized protein (TIGR00251 family)
MAACQLRLRVTPRARRNEVVGERGDMLAVKLTAAPVKGAANKALLQFLAERLGLPPRCLAIVGGETSREKRLAVEGLTESEARARLLGPP